MGQTLEIRPSRERDRPDVAKTLTTLDAQTALEFWDASLHSIAPALRTTLGHFATLNSCTRVTLTTSTTAAMIYVIAWSPSGVSGWGFTADNSSTNFGTTAMPAAYSPLLNTASITAMRPLRMTYRLTNTTSDLNVGGEVRIGIFDEPLLYYGAFNGLVGAAAVLPATSSTQLRDMATSSGPGINNYSQTKLRDGVKIVLPPSSYITYNNYRTQLPTSLSTAATPPVSVDNGSMNSLFTGKIPYVAATSQIDEQYLGAVPPFRWSIVYFGPTTAANTYSLEIFRQDGARFVANTLGDTFTHPPAPLSAAAEDRILQSITLASSATDEALPYTAGATGPSQFAAQVFAETMYRMGPSLVYALRRSLEPRPRNALGN